MKRKIFGVLALVAAMSGRGANDPYDYKELETTASCPVEVRKGLFDFGKDGIGWLEFHGAKPGVYSAVPLNIISRYVLGVTPLDPGFAKISVKPQVGDLKSVKGVVPTAKGPVTVEISDDRLIVSTPASARIVWNGRTREISAGRHEFN